MQALPPDDMGNVRGAPGSRQASTRVPAANHGSLVEVLANVRLHLFRSLSSSWCTFFCVLDAKGFKDFSKESHSSQKLKSKTYPRSVTALKSENQRFIKGISRLSEAEIKDLSQESQSSDSKSPGSGPEQKPGSITEFCARWRRACRDLCRLQYAAQAVWSPKEPEPPPKSSRTSRPGGVYFRVVSFSTLQVRTSAWKWM